MTISQLQYFLAVCDCGSITNAASELFISQQALSKTINTLERELDTALFLRCPSGIILTKAGILLRDECRPIVEQFEQFVFYIHHTVGKSRDILRLGIFEDCYSLITIDEFNEFRALFPQYKLDIQEFQFQVCNQRLIEGRHDVVLTIEPIMNQSIVNIPLQTYQLVIVLNRDDSLAQLSEIRFQDICQRELVMCIDGCGYRFVSRLLEEQAIKPVNVQRVSQLSNMSNFCSKNGYLGLTADYSAKAILTYYPRLIVKPLEGRPSPYTVTLAYHINNKGLKVLDDFIWWIKTQMADKEPMM